MTLSKNSASEFRLENMFYGVFNENQTFLYFIFACVSICTNVCCVNILGIYVVYIPKMRLNHMIFVVTSTILRGVYVWINH